MPRPVTLTILILWHFAEFLSLQVPHSVTLMEQYDLLCIADRENMRVICVKAELHGYNSGLQINSLNIQQPDLGRVFAIVAHGKYNVTVKNMLQKGKSKTTFRGRGKLDNEFLDSFLVEKKELPISSHFWPHTGNCPKLKRKMWHSLFHFHVHIRDELHLYCQKIKSASSLTLIFKIKIFWRVVCSERTIRNFGHTENTSSRHQ